MQKQPSNNLVEVLTLVLWTGALAVGVAGMRLAHPRPRPPAQEPPPAQAMVIQVQVQKETLAPAPKNPAPQKQAEVIPAPLLVPEQPPQIALDTTPPPLAPLVTLNPFVERVQPAPAIRTVPATQATTSAPIAPVAPVIQQLTLGQGEGVQPMPEYPREAQLARQEGTVVIRFSVDSEGGVDHVAAISPSPFPLLNQAAIRAVRDTWRFAPGSPRLFEVSISFQLRRTN